MKWRYHFQQIFFLIWYNPQKVLYKKAGKKYRTNRGLVWEKGRS